MERLKTGFILFLLITLGYTGAAFNFPDVSAQYTEEPEIIIECEQGDNCDPTGLEIGFDACGQRVPVERNVEGNLQPEGDSDYVPTGGRINTVQTACTVASGSITLFRDGSEIASGGSLEIQPNSMDESRSRYLYVRMNSKQSISGEQTVLNYFMLSNDVPSSVSRDTAILLVESDVVNNERTVVERSEGIVEFTASPSETLQPIAVDKESTCGENVCAPDILDETFKETAHDPIYPATSSASPVRSDRFPTNYRPRGDIVSGESLTDNYGNGFFVCSPQLDGYTVLANTDKGEGEQRLRCDYQGDGDLGWRDFTARDWEVVTRCSDGIDNDGDGQIDFLNSQSEPSDTGCTDWDDPTEGDNCEPGASDPEYLVSSLDPRTGETGLEPYDSHFAQWKYTDENCQTEQKYEQATGTTVGEYSFVKPANIPDKASQVKCPGSATNIDPTKYVDGNYEERDGTNYEVACLNSEVYIAVFNGTFTGNVVRAGEGFEKEGPHVQRLPEAKQQFTGGNDLCSSEGNPTGEITGVNCYDEQPYGWTPVNLYQNLENHPDHSTSIPTQTWLDLRDNLEYSGAVVHNGTIPDDGTSNGHWTGGWIPNCQTGRTLTYLSAESVWSCQAGATENVIVQFPNVSEQSVDTYPKYRGLKIYPDFKNKWNSVMSTSFSDGEGVAVYASCWIGKPGNKPTDGQYLERSFIEINADSPTWLVLKFEESEVRNNADLSSYSCDYGFRQSQPDDIFQGTNVDGTQLQTSTVSNMSIENNEGMRSKVQENYFDATTSYEELFPPNEQPFHNP